MKKNFGKNLFLATVLMLTTFCMGCANVVKDTHRMDNNNNIPEENLPTGNKPTGKNPPIMSGKVMPLKDKPEEKIEPLAGEVMPLPPKKEEINIKPLAGVAMRPENLDKDSKKEQIEPPAIAGDIPPRHFRPDNNKNSGFESVKSFFKNTLKNFFIKLLLFIFYKNMRKLCHIKK